MMLCAMESPRPVPAPSGLVVKNGSKIRLCKSGGTPGPLSSIEMSRAAGVIIRVVILRVRGGGEAAMA